MPQPSGRVHPLQGRWPFSGVARRWRGLGLASLASLGLGLTAFSVQAGPAPLDPRVYPPASLFRSLQLTTLACSRENNAGSCQQARQQADPLLDHPRLPASCKDALWSIRERAVVASDNTYQRREGIDRLANDLVVFCRERGKPSGKPNESAAPGSPFSGINPSQK